MVSVDARTAPAGATRSVLCVFPRHAKSFGTFEHAFPLAGVQAFVPPQGILTIAGYLPDDWPVRFVDENVAEVAEADLAWADVVLLTGMHVQRAAVDRLAVRARVAGKLSVLGGPSVSASPELYPDVDLLRVGELGDATDVLITRLAADVTPPPSQQVYRTVERLSMSEFPAPRYELIDLGDYLLASAQFSSGCPFQCEFCDLPGLYGRVPRLKSVDQVTRELDALLARGNPGTVYFVDDNFIANPNAAVTLLCGLVEWQQSRGYPLSSACEATMNLAQRCDVLDLMQQASFTQVFLGVESPNLEVLRTIRKTQNLRTPLLDTVAALNARGIEVVAGIIMGLDSDDDQSGRRVLDFVHASQVPMLTINLLHALPRTPLWDRLEREGRLLRDPGDRGSNGEFTRPYADVVADWRATVTAACTPAELYRRFAHQISHTYPHRRQRPQQRPSAADLRRGLRVLARIFYHIGVKADYRRDFWTMALPLLRQGRIEKVIHITTVTHHLVTFAREVERGTAEKCFYNPHGGSAGSDLGVAEPTSTRATARRLRLTPVAHDPSATTPVLAERHDEGSRRVEPGITAR